MADSGGYQEPKLGATFYPGGQDDFLMPELISPSPQRYVLLPFVVGDIITTSSWRLALIRTVAD